MTQPLVFTFVAADQPGLVETLSHTVAAHGGNWLESRMSELAGQFAGIVKVAVAEPQAAALRAALQALSAHQLHVVVADSPAAAAPAGLRTLHLSILGNDRPSIVREVAHALASRQVSVSAMDTRVRSAPMSGDALFDAQAQIQVPGTLDLTELRDQLDAIADALSLDIALDDMLG